MAYRSPDNIIHNGKSLAVILSDHAEWLRTGGEKGKRADLQSADLRGADLQGANLWDANLQSAILQGANLWDADLQSAILQGADLRGANFWDAILQGANLRGANLWDADLRGANFWGCTGNMIEIKSAHFDTWPIAWVQSPEGKTFLQIGCQGHALEMWEKSDPRWIETLDGNAPEWWAKYREIVLSLVNASPAVPYGKGKT